MIQSRTIWFLITFATHFLILRKMGHVFVGSKHFSISISRLRLIGSCLFLMRKMTALSMRCMWRSYISLSMGRKKISRSASLYVRLHCNIYFRFFFAHDNNDHRLPYVCKKTQNRYQTRSPHRQAEAEKKREFVF